MSSSSKPLESGNSRVPKQKIEAAMQEVSAVRMQYIRRVQSQQVTPDLLREFHSAVMVYFTELRPYREEECLGRKWQTARLWPKHGNWDADVDEEEQWVTGIETLMRFIDYRVEQPSQSGGWGTSSESKTVSTHLPPEKLLRVSFILDEIAKDLGISIDVNQGKRPIGMLDEREREVPADDE